MVNLLKVTILLILATLAPSVTADDGSGERIATVPDDPTSEVSPGMLTLMQFSLELLWSNLERTRNDLERTRNTIDLVWTHLDRVRQDLRAERQERREEIAWLRERIDELMTTGDDESWRDDLNELRDELTSVRSDLDTECDAQKEEITRLSERLDKFGSVAFHATLFLSGTPLPQSPTIRQGENLKFNIVRLNIGNGYNRTTGIFTVPPGRGGLYYFYVHLLIDEGKFAWFFLSTDGLSLCRLKGDSAHNSPGDTDTGTCAATVELYEGDRVYVVRYTASDDTPLDESHTYNSSCGFTGFLLRPAD